MGDVYAFPGGDREDREQDAALRRLTGESPTGRTRTREYASDRPREYGYGLVPGEDGLIDTGAPSINHAALQEVITWSLSQAGDVRLAIVEYLESPDDAQLERVLELIDVEDRKPAQKEATLSEMIARALPATLDDLYVLARRVHHSKRPEAAVRQTIRNMRKRGTIIEDERGTYVKVEE